MKCYNHPTRDAVSTCTVCGRGLCKECTDKYSPVMCDICKEKERMNAKMEAAAQKSRAKSDLVIDIIFSFVNVLLGFGIAWLIGRFFDSQWQSVFHSYYYLFIIFLPFSFRTISAIISPAGCLTLILNFVLASALGPVFFFVGVWRYARGIRKGMNNSPLGIILEIIYILAIVVFVVITILFFVGDRMEFLENKYGMTVDIWP